MNSGSYFEGMIMISEFIKLTKNVFDENFSIQKKCSFKMKRKNSIHFFLINSFSVNLYIACYLYLECFCLPCFFCLREKSTLLLQMTDRTQHTLGERRKKKKKERKNVIFFYDIISNKIYGC